MNRARARVADVLAAAPVARTALLACLLTCVAFLLPATALAGAAPEVLTGQKADLSTPVYPQPVTASQEIVSGWVNPHGLSTTYALEYAPAGDQFCTSGATQGTPSTTSSSTLQFTDSSPHLVSVTVVGLTNGTRYCSVLVATGSAGTTAGPNIDHASGLPTPFYAGVPFVTTAAATATGPQRVSLHGTVNPASQAATYYALYDAASSGWCNGTPNATPSGQSTPITLPSQNSGPDAVSFNVTASDPQPLLPNTEYCVAIAARNASSDIAGTALTLVGGNAITTFTTPPAATDTSIESTSATTAQLSGTIDPDGVTTTYDAAYGPIGSDWCQSGAATGSPALVSSSQTLGFQDQNAHDVTVSLSGLTTGTTYCAVLRSDNAPLGVWQAPVDTTYPPMFTAGLPSATTLDVNPDAPTTAVLDGSVSPAGQTTTYEAVYDLQSSNWCQGGGAPVDGASFLPTGAQVLAQADSGTYDVSAHMTGLTPGTSYCVALAAVNGSNGQSGSPPLSFTGPPVDFTAGLPPTAGAASVLNQTASTSAVSAAVNAESQSTAYHVAYDTVGSDWCNGGSDNPGSVTGDAQVSPADLIDHNVTVNLTGLQGGTAYCAAMVATNNTGSVTGPQVQFVAGLPVATTGSLVQASPTSELVSGAVTPTSQASSYHVAYDLASSEWCLNGGAPSGAGFDTSPVALGGPVDDNAHSVTATIAGLAAGENYCAELVATNASGVGPSAQHAFTAGYPFTATTLAAEPPTSSSVTIDGTVNPAGLATTYWVAYDLQDTEWCFSGGRFGLPGQASAPVSVAATDIVDHAVAASVAGLRPGTAYCAELEATNDMGTIDGGLVSFTTAAAPAGAATTPVGGATTPSDPGTTSGSGTPPTPSAGPARASVAAASTTASGTAAKLTLSCPAASSAACQVTATLAVTEKFKVVAITGHKTVKRTVVLGSASATLAPGTQRTVTVSLDASGRKLIKSHRALTVQLLATQDGKSLATRTLTLSTPRAPKSKRK